MAENGHRPNEGEHSLQEGGGAQRAEGDGSAQRKEKEGDHNDGEDCAHRARIETVAQQGSRQSPARRRADEQLQEAQMHAKREGVS